MLMLAVLALATAEPPAVTPPADDTASSLAGLQQMYDQSCAAREYGAYDDLCDQLSHQLRDARAEAAREARRNAVEARRHPRAAPASPRPPVPAPPTKPAPAPSTGTASPE